MSNIQNIIFSIAFHSFIICSPFSYRGILSLSNITTDDPPKDWSSYQSVINYIPTFSLKQGLIYQRMIDTELSYHFNVEYLQDSLFNNFEKQLPLHRLWIRYTNEKLEARLGLQKIIFGPTQILRPLSWFDTFDLKDPIGQTKGVDALRFKWFPIENISFWSWLIHNDQDETTSVGGRTELSSSIGEFGLTFHLDPSNSYQNIGQTQTFISDSHYRAAIDYRYDGAIGFWNESTRIESEKSEIYISSVGADYTIPIANGVLLMAETMYIHSKYDNLNNNQNYSVFMTSLPIGIIHSAIHISRFDWSEKKIYHYFRWSSSFNTFSLNLILSINPNRNQYNVPENVLPKSLSGFGKAIQFVFTYNH